MKQELHLEIKIKIIQNEIVIITVGDLDHFVSQIAK